MTTRKKKPRRRRLSLNDLYYKRDKALERVVDIWLHQVGAGDGDELMKALDVLTVAHTTATFEYASGSFSS
jgi:hypothetical protein